MAKQAKIQKALQKPKFSTRAYTRCSVCGRPRAVYKQFGVCRLCFRKMALQGLLPGVTKASW